MQASPTTDPLALWRGIDDAVWREAVRQALPPPPRPASRPQPAAVRALEPA